MNVMKKTSTVIQHYLSLQSMESWRRYQAFLCFITFNYFFRLLTVEDLVLALGDRLLLNEEAIDLPSSKSSSPSIIEELPTDKSDLKLVDEFSLLFLRVLFRSYMGDLDLSEAISDNSFL